MRRYGPNPGHFEVGFSTVYNNVTDKDFTTLATISDYEYDRRAAGCCVD